jgi:hypothetical protein
MSEIVGSSFGLGWHLVGLLWQGENHLVGKETAQSQVAPRFLQNSQKIHVNLIDELVK